MRLIPIKDIATKSSIRLRTEPKMNNQGFQTYVYRVQISDNK